MSNLNKNAKCIFWGFLAFFVAILFITFMGRNPAADTVNIQLEKIEKSVEILPVFSKKEDLIICIKDSAKINLNKTDIFFENLNICIKKCIGIEESELDFIENNVSNEKKVFLPMADSYRELECRWLTIGIGGSIAAEETIKARYPNCLIYGADPTDIGEFAKVGKVLPFGVGIEDKEITLSVNIIGKGYQNRTEKVIALPKVLDQYLHSRLIHYLSIDAEGYEMILLRELIGNDGILVNENIIFCQIDVELHDPKQESITSLATNINRVQWVLDFIQPSSPYLPIFTVPYPPAHKVTFVNTQNSECNNAFNIYSVFNII